MSSDSAAASFSDGSMAFSAAPFLVNASVRSASLSMSAINRASATSGGGYDGGGISPMYLPGWRTSGGSSFHVPSGLRRVSSNSARLAASICAWYSSS